MVDRSGTGVQPVPATSYLEGFVGLTDQAKANLTNENLFGSHDGEFINQNTMAELFRQARNGNAEAVSVLMHYTCHDSRQVRAFAKAHIGDLYRESPRMVGEMAGEIVEIYTSMKSKNPESTFLTPTALPSSPSFPRSMSGETVIQVTALMAKQWTLLRRLLTQTVWQFLTMPKRF